MAPEGRAQARDRGARHPKKPRRTSLRGNSEVRVHAGICPRISSVCDVPGVRRASQWLYGWLRQQTSAREREDTRLLGRIKHFWLASGGVYGHRKITCDLREAGERRSRYRVRRLMKRKGLRAQIGYGSKPCHRGGPVGVVANVLDRECAPDAPNKVWSRCAQFGPLRLRRARSSPHLACALLPPLLMQVMHLAKWRPTAGGWLSVNLVA